MRTVKLLVKYRKAQLVSSTETGFSGRARLWSDHSWGRMGQPPARGDTAGQALPEAEQSCVEGTGV